MNDYDYQLARSHVVQSIREVRRTEALLEEKRLAVAVAELKAQWEGEQLQKNRAAPKDGPVSVTPTD